MLPPGQRRRLHSQERHLIAEGTQSTAPLIVNLMVNRAWARPQMMAPTLLCGSMLWMMRKQRPFIPSEHLEIQGFCIHNANAPWASFAEELTILPLKGSEGACWEHNALEQHRSAYHVRARMHSCGLPVGGGF